MLKTVLLYGELRRRFGKRHRLAVRTPAEAIRALRANHRGFEKLVAGGRFHVIVGKESVSDYEDIHNPSHVDEVIKIIPLVGGAKSPFFQILLGAVLITTAIVFSGGLGALALPLGIFGASMVIGGVAQLLTKPPEKPSYGGDPERRESYLFNGPVNTSAQGATVPAVYGQMIVGSKVVSAGIETHEEA